jgi:hypothetical protein
VNDFTVAFDMVRPNGLFPYLLGQMVYQAVILPRSYASVRHLEAGRVDEQDERHRTVSAQEKGAQVGYTFEANLNYWGGKPSIDTVVMQISTTRRGLPDRATARPRHPDHVSAQQLDEGSNVLLLGREPPLPEHERDEGSVQRRARTPGSRRAQPAPSHRPVGEVRRDRERQPLWRGYPYTRSRSAAQAWTSTGEGTAQGSR